VSNTAATLSYNPGALPLMVMAGCGRGEMAVAPSAMHVMLSVNAGWFVQPTAVASDITGIGALYIDTQPW